MKYDPIMCMMVPDTVKTKDAMFVQLRFSSGRTEGAKLEESEYREYAEALLNKYGEKMVTISKNGKAIATYMNRSKLFKDSNTLDKAIRNCDRDPYEYETIKNDIDVAARGKASYITKSSLQSRITRGFQTNRLTKEEKEELWKMSERVSN